MGRFDSSRLGTQFLGGSGRHEGINAHLEPGVLIPSRSAAHLSYSWPPSSTLRWAVRGDHLALDGRNLRA